MYDICFLVAVSGYPITNSLWEEGYILAQSLRKGTMYGDRKGTAAGVEPAHHMTLGAEPAGHMTTGAGPTGHMTPALRKQSSNQVKPGLSNPTSPKEPPPPKGSTTFQNSVTI